jgi:hypothetical protein
MRKGRERSISLEVPLCEFVTGAGFQVSLKSASQFRGSEFDTNVNKPRLPRSRRYGLPGIMKLQPSRRISSGANVPPAGIFGAAKDIDEMTVQQQMSPATFGPRSVSRNSEAAADGEDPIG